MWFLFRCVFRLPLCVNESKHWLHEKGLCPEWNRWCFLKFSGLVNNFTHWVQENCFSWVCIVWCLLRQIASLNDFSHLLQENILLPMPSPWVLECLLWLLACTNVLSQNWQQNGLSTVCILMWAFRLQDTAKDLVQWLQEKLFFRNEPFCVSWDHFYLRMI